MTLLTVCGWVVVHAAWECTFIAGLTGLTLGLLRTARPEARDRVARISLALMAVVPFITAILKADVLPQSTRRMVFVAIDRAMPMPTYLEWRSMVIPSIGGAWAIGVCVCLIRLAVAWRRTVALGALHPDDAGVRLGGQVETLRTRLAVTNRVTVRRSGRAHVPMVLGWRRPMILVPEPVIAALRPEALNVLLAHELAHVRRRDYLANLLQCVADSVTFFHPAARWVSRRIRIEREYCCDDAAIAVAGDRAGYAHALAALDDARVDGLLAVAATSGTLLDRIERIAGRPRRLLTATGGAAIMLAATAAAAILLGAALALPQNIPPGARLRSSRPPAAGMMPSPATSPPAPKRQRS